MFEGIIEGLLTAWVLSLFHVDRICINVLQPFFTNIKLTKDYYYFAAGIIGLITWMIIHRK